VVAPDLGAVELGGVYARLLALPLAVVSKTRISPREVTVRGIVGDVRDRRPLVVDDMISTGATIRAAVETLLDQGCRPQVVVAATHALLVGDAPERLDRPEVARVVVTDSLPPASRVPARLDVVRLAPSLAEAVRRMAGGIGLGDLLAAR
jgi:ribose-phosphate pyrophosphokinase